jgi:hypothetical protein
LSKVVVNVFVFKWLWRRVRHEREGIL